jgi:hypothetical protein
MWIFAALVLMISVFTAFSDFWEYAVCAVSMCGYVASQGWMNVFSELMYFMAFVYDKHVFCEMIQCMVTLQVNTECGFWINIFDSVCIW